MVEPKLRLTALELSELQELQDQAWVKVHPLRDGGWATAMAQELCALRHRSRSTS